MKLIRRTEAKERGRVCDPIDPEYLRIAGIIKTDTRLGAPVAGPGEGRQVYRMFCNRGNWGDDNQMGLLLLEASKARRNGEEEIHFLQVSRDGGEQSADNRYKPFQVAYRLEGRMRCRENIPQSWEISGGFYDYSNGQSGILIEGTGLTEEVRVRKGSLEVRTGNKVFKRDLHSSNWMSEWNLLRLVNRLSFDEEPKTEFCLLEGLSLPKYNAFLVNTGKHEAPEFGSDLYSFTLIGRGIVPFDFWMDGSHRLIGCISGGLGRAYIPEELLIPPVEEFIVQEFKKVRSL